MNITVSSPKRLLTQGKYCYQNTVAGSAVEPQYANGSTTVTELYFLKSDPVPIV